MTLNNKEKLSVIKEFSNYGVVLYYLLSQNKMSMEEIENVLLKDNYEQINLLFPKLILKIDPLDLDKSYNLYKIGFTKMDCINKVINLDEDKYSHLRDIKDVALSEDEIDKIISDDTYNFAMNIFFTKKILFDLKEKHSKAFISVRNLVKDYYKQSELLDSDVNTMIGKDIDNYYINKVCN